MPDHTADPAGERTAERPRGVTGAATLMRDTTGSVLLHGGATKLDWAGRVDQPDHVVDTTAMAGVLTHNPADMTASVRAGTTLNALQEHLASDGQWLALDPASGGHGATVGGLLAAGDSGPSRLRYGGLRDLVIGVTLVLADGTVARSGSHVIKNVAGYDLAKLVHGSLGSLALVAEVIVRLHPRPPVSTTLRAAADADQATAATLEVMASPLEPAAVEWVSASTGGTGPGELYLRLDGTPAAVQVSAGRLTGLLRGLGIEPEHLDGPSSEQAWADHADAVLGGSDETVVRVAGLPSAMAAQYHRAVETTRATGADITMVSSVALGMHTLRVRADDASDHAAALTSVRQHAEEAGASVLLRQRPAELDDLVDALGTPPSSVQLLRRVKAQLDPDGRLAPGRFRPWY